MLLLYFFFNLSVYKFLNLLCYWFMFIHITFLNYFNSSFILPFFHFLILNYKIFIIIFFFIYFFFYKKFKISSVFFFWLLHYFIFFIKLFFFFLYIFVLKFSFYYFFFFFYSSNDYAQKKIHEGFFYFFHNVSLGQQQNLVFFYKKNTIILHIFDLYAAVYFIGIKRTKEYVSWLQHTSYFRKLRKLPISPLLRTLICQKFFFYKYRVSPLKNRYVFVFIEDIIVQKNLLYRRIMRKKYCLFLFYKKIYFNLIYPTKNKEINRIFLFEKMFPDTHPEMYKKKKNPFFFEGFFYLTYKINIYLFRFFSLFFFQFLKKYYCWFFKFFLTYNYRKKYQNLFWQSFCSFFFFDYGTSFIFIKEIFKFYF